MVASFMLSVVSGTNIEQWSPPEALAQCSNNSRGSALYNGMVAPLLQTSVKGWIWYQGEANVGEAIYGCRFKALINAWRQRWNVNSVSNQIATTRSPLSSANPFVFVQLAPYHADNGNTECLIEGGASRGKLATQRLLQTQALTLPAVGMASAVDLGDSASPYWPGSVHPRSKQPVGRRLALEAMRLGYEQSRYFNWALARGLTTKTPAAANTALVSRGPQF